MMTLTAWALTTGEAGMRTQARGLAKAVADRVEEKTALAFWRWRPGRSDLTSILKPPWPDVVISCGRRSVSTALRIKRASGNRTLAVHVQDPRRRAGEFDLIVAMDHDRIQASEHVMKVSTALHDLTPESLRVAGDIWRKRLSALGRPMVGVVVGGDLKGRPFTRTDARGLIEGLLRLRREAGAALAITPSRRTPAHVLAALATAFPDDPQVFVWDGAGENPYRGILALSDRLVVTSDSVSMVSEALSAPHPVEVYDLGFPRHVPFIQGLVDNRLVRRFAGDPTPPTTLGPVNATQKAALALRALLQARTGSLG